MRDNILCLPVHDQIADGDVEKMGGILRPLLSRDQFSQRAKAVQRDHRASEVVGKLHVRVCACNDKGGK